MKKQYLKGNKGVTITDIVVAMIILSLFVGLIGNLYYQIALQNSIVQSNAVAAYYVVKIAEDIDKMPYESVTNELSNTVKQTYELPDGINIMITVEKYSEIDPTKEDIVKTVSIRAEYECFEQTRVYEVKKLKIKEIAKENS